MKKSSSPRRFLSALLVLYVSFFALSLSFVHQQRHHSRPTRQQKSNQRVEAFTYSARFDHRSALSASSRTQQLLWIEQGVEKLLQQNDEDPSRKNQRRLLGALKALSKAKMSHEVIQAGRRLDKEIPYILSLSTDVRDRIAKAAAIAGLFPLAFKLTDSILEERCLPSNITQEALGSSLRRARKSKLLKTFVSDLINATKDKDDCFLSTPFFNTYLASLCETNDPSDILEATSYFIGDKSSTSVTLNSISYATVLNKITCNQTLFETLWNSTSIRSVEMYNARLKLQSDNSEKIRVYREMNRIVDRYTVGSLLVPLYQQQEFDEIEYLLDTVVKSYKDRTVSDAFSSYLLTLVRNGALMYAQEVFDKYISPAVSPVVSAPASQLRFVSPNIKHFNILLDGYAKLHVRNETSHEIIHERVWSLFGIADSSRLIQPDAYTFCAVLPLCNTPTLVLQIVQRSYMRLGNLSEVVMRAALTQLGSLADPSSAIWLFLSSSAPRSLRNTNVLLGALAKSCALDPWAKIDLESNLALQSFAELLNGDVQSTPLGERLQNTTVFAAVKMIQKMMENDEERREMRFPRPDSQTYCLVASAQQYTGMGSEQALKLFDSSSSMGIPADGRFVNALFRCFDGDIDAAVSAWKDKIRPICLKYENRPRSKTPAFRRPGKNLIAAYSGLVYVCGQARRPDVALRLIYAMRKEGLEPNETLLNIYNAGKIKRMVVKENESFKSQILDAANMKSSYELLLYVECTKYDTRDKRRQGEKRVRIIL